MQVTVVLDHRFLAAPDGSYWTDGPFPYSFFKRYLEVFDQVRVVARTAIVTEARPIWQRADGDGVAFDSVPCYLGPYQYLMQRSDVAAAVEIALEVESAVILRAPSQLAILAEHVLHKQARPYAVEIVADPYAALGPGADSRLLRPLFRVQQTRALKRICKRAAAASYVTESALQELYPVAAGVFATHYSSVELTDAAFLGGAPRPRHPPSRLVSVGSMEHLYKGYDLLIDALAICRTNGRELTLELVGDGRLRSQLEGRAAKSGLSDQVEFRGQLPSGAAVRRELDASDIFVLPSRQEGVPRAMIEAMARGLPCIGSSVGGIPELLGERELIPPNDTRALAQRLGAFADDASWRQAAAVANLERARDYHDDCLGPRRREFYEQALASCSSVAQAA